MWNNSIKLSTDDGELDDDGYKKKVKSYTKSIPANFLDTTRDDEILANQLGYTAHQVVEIVACNYSGQKYLLSESDNMEYEVKRTFKKNKSMYIQLTCERR